MDREVFQERFGMLGDSDAIRHVIDKIMQVSGTDITVLLEGESGVGKDVTARALHAMSNRKHNDLVIVNCGAIPEGIIESELFGHEKGSFTGAHESRKGYFEKADQGTIFLDEIGDTPKNVQVKLLRVLETGEFFRVGSSKVSTTDVRVIAATNQDLWQMVEEGSFREDLYYRLDTVKIKLPPLRERSEDIIPIFRKFVNEFSSKYDSVFRGFSDEARELLTSYRWPGNIRELRNVAEQLVVLEKSQYVDADTLRKYLKGRQREGIADNLPVISDPARQNFGEEYTPGGSTDQALIYRALMELQNDMSDLKKMLGRLIYTTFSGKEIRALPPAMQRSINPEDLGPQRSGEPSSSHDFSPTARFSEDDSLKMESQLKEEDEFSRFLSQEELPSIEETEKFLIQQALKKFEGNRRKASEVLGISERTLYRKLDQYDLT